MIEKINLKDMRGCPVKFGVDELNLGRVNLIIGKNGAGKSALLRDVQWCIHSWDRLADGSLSMFYFGETFVNTGYYKDGVCKDIKHGHYLGHDFHIRELLNDMKFEIIADLRMLGLNVFGVSLGDNRESLVVSYGHADAPTAMTSLKNLSRGEQKIIMLLIQIATALHSTKNCQENIIIIDDVCNGLDYELSAKFMKFLIEKSERDNFQLIMSTLDRYAINAAPIESLVVLENHGDKIGVYDSIRYKDNFDYHESVGLGNFNLLTTKHYKGRQGEFVNQ